MNRKISFIASLLCLGLAQITPAYAVETGKQSRTSDDKTLKQTMKAAPGPYGYPLPRATHGQLGRPGWPYYGPAYYPVDQQRFNSRNRHRFNGRNDWFGDNRMNHWNRVVSDMVSDMFGDGAGDIDFDVNIKFKARGKGNAKGRGNADADRYSRFRTEQNYRGRGNSYGRGDARQQTGLGRYNSFSPDPYRYSYPYPAYPPYPAYAPAYKPGNNATSSPVTTYPSYPPVAPANAAK